MAEGQSWGLNPHTKRGMIGLLYGTLMMKGRVKAGGMSWDWESRDAAGPFPFSKSSSLLGRQLPFSCVSAMPLFQGGNRT